MTTKPRIETIHIWMLMTIPLMIGVLAAASTQEEPQGAGFLETVKVNLVEIDVVVTDRDGNPVGGLTVEDFQLSEDGRKVKLTHFRAGQGGLPGGGAMDPELTAAPSPPSYVVLLIDNFAIHPANRARVASGLEDYLARELDGDTWFAIASYDGYLNMRQTFTQDRALLQEAVGGLEEISALGTLRMVERQATFRAGLETLRSIEALVGDPTRGESVPRRLATFSRQINAQAEEIRQQNLATFVAFGHLVNALSPLPGRKAVVYVSDGLPMRPGTELQEATQAAFRDLEIRDPATASSHDSRQAQIDQRSGALDVLSGSVPSRSRKGGRGSASPGQGPDGLLELTAMANAYQVSFYTLKPVSDYGGMAAEFDGDLGRLLTPQLQGVREQNLAETLEVLAGDTGGLSMRGTDIESVIDRARGDFRNHYSLGYTPAHEGDGRYHQIKLKVRGKKLRARYRGGYVDKSIEARIADRTTAALLLALDDNPHGIRLSTAAPEPAAENGQWVVPVEIEIPLAALTLVDRGEMMIGEAQLFVAVRGMDGRTAPVQAMDLRLEVPNSGEDPRGQSYTARFDLGMRSGVQRIAFGLLDPRTEVVSFVSKEVLVGVDR